MSEPRGTPKRTPLALVVMGVSGCGKSTLGTALAERLGAPFLEGDAYHPPENVAKMASGTPLDDADRWPWLDRLGAALGDAARHEGTAIAACSALKRVYRTRLAAAAALPLRFVFLDGPQALFEARMKARPHHYMPPSLLASQFATLERPGPDEDALTLDVADAKQHHVEAALVWLGRK